MAAELRDDIAAARDRLKGPKIGAGRELRKLVEHLAPGEDVSAVAPGTFGGSIGLLVLTDRRILFVLETITKRTMEDFPLRAITSVTSKSGIINATVSIMTGGARAEITSVYKDDAKAFVDLARDAVATYGSAPAPAAAAPSTADELVKLAGLRDQGVLTDEEFTAAKARLLA